MINFLCVVGLACFPCKFDFFFLLMILNKRTYSVTATKGPNKGVKEESPRNHTDLTDKFHLGKHFKSH